MDEQLTGLSAMAAVGASFEGQLDGAMDETVLDRNDQYAGAGADLFDDRTPVGDGILGQKRRQEADRSAAIDGIDQKIGELAAVAIGFVGGESAKGHLARWKRRSQTRDSPREI